MARLLSLSFGAHVSVTYEISSGTCNFKNFHSMSHITDPYSKNFLCGYGQNDCDGTISFTYLEIVQT